MRRVCLLTLCLLLVSGLLAGCGQNTSTDESESSSTSSLNMYYLNEDATELVTKSYTPTEESPKALLKEMMQVLQSGNDSDNTLSLLPVEVQISTYTITDTTLTIDFSETYRDMDPSREILARAGIVMLFVQIPGIDYVKFTIDGKDLEDSKGMPISIMNDETFVDYSGGDINTYQYATIRLYFANGDGSMLIPEERTVYFNSNVPLELVVVQQLVEGPSSENLRATLPDTITILGVTSDENSCYVNLGSSFITDALMLKDPSLAIYSIVNSLTEACQVSQVQISVNGETDLLYQDDLSLNQFFKNDPDLIEDNEEEEEETGEEEPS